MAVLPKTEPPKMTADPARVANSGPHKLTAAQMAAVQPDENIWLSASAGTGKTQVLTARVIRLLMTEYVGPENLLCITFTKAGAAEMAERINRILAAWVQMDDAILTAELSAIGVSVNENALKHARQLFARILDAPGGGLQILTIHSLCQSLLGSFPEEAMLAPGFRAIEGRDQDELYREALSRLIARAERDKDDRTIDALQKMSMALGEERAIRFLQKYSAHPVLSELADDGDALSRVACEIAGVEFDRDFRQKIADKLDDSRIDRIAMIAAAQMNDIWGKGNADSRGRKRAAAIHHWLSLDIAGRLQGFDDFYRCWAHPDGKAYVNVRGSTPQGDEYADLVIPIYEWGRAIAERIILGDYAGRLASAFMVGEKFTAEYRETKALRGLVDFNDMIEKTANLLRQGGMADWVRYKLDRRIDHILVDEAQDTNTAQWDILRALSDDFFAGQGASEDRVRTIFSVGDYKQAIFGFQGTDPVQYAGAGHEYEEKIAASGKELQRLTLSRSFRSTRPVLDFVNAVIEICGPEKFGIRDPIEPHYGEAGDFGLVELLEPVRPPEDDEAVDGNDGGYDGRQILASRIASHVGQLLSEGTVIASSGRPVRPGDIMILLRSRGSLAALIVSHLHAINVPVAGIDRLRLLDSLAVQDLLSVIRFVLQPDDDLSLACIMVSPLVGWTQEQLLLHGYRAPQNRNSLWRHLREKSEIADDITPLREMLAVADYESPYQFLEHILSGPVRGRQKMQARLGRECLIPIEEFLNSALQFEKQVGGGLQAFLAWVESGETIISRDGAAQADEVRVMTVHGSKGLEAPVVILADTCFDPLKKPENSSELLIDDGRRLPLVSIRKMEKVGRLAILSDRQQAAELEEHFRLLYVAMTRARERLILAGVMGGRKGGDAPPESWYAAMRSALENMNAEKVVHPIFGTALRYEGKESAPQRDHALSGAVKEIVKALPESLLRPAPEESRPPRPLAPSQLDIDDYGRPPARSGATNAAEKGRLVHALFERITGGDIGRQLELGRSWLARNNRNPDIDNGLIWEQVRAIVSKPEWADFFGPDAQAEVPLAALVGEVVISGRVDRLVIGPERIRLLDFKTGRYPAGDASELPTAFLRQMAHYAAALESIFPGRQVEASLLFTEGPELVLLPDNLLAPFKPAS